MTHENQPREAWQNDDPVTGSGTTPASMKTGRWSSKAGRSTHTVYPVKFLVTTGSLESGFTFYGPFDHPTTAREWARTNLMMDTPFSVFNLQNVGDTA